MMGKYFNVHGQVNADILKSVGARQLSKAPYKELVEQLHPGEAVGFLGDRGVFCFCAWCFNEEEFQEFYKQRDNLLH